MDTAPTVTSSTRSSSSCQNTAISCSPFHPPPPSSTITSQRVSITPPTSGTRTQSNTAIPHHGHHRSHHSMTGVGTPPPQQVAGSVGPAGSTVRNGLGGSSANANTKGRRLLIVRHGERVDFTFNSTHESWVSKAFDAQGRYKRFNINMPRTLPARKDGYAAYALDTPLTEIGYLQAKLTGRALKEAGTKPTHVYVSPAYRSIQTCVGILKGMQSQSQNVSFNIEPGLFEWGAWFRPKVPSWMSADEYASQGYAVNVHYKPIIAHTEITSSESLLDYYNRSHKVVQRILERHRDDCIILLVAHGASLDTCTRQICGCAPRNQQEFYAVLHKTPYLALASMAEDINTGAFRIAEPPILPFEHQSNVAYDWRILTASLGQKV